MEIVKNLKLFRAQVRQPKRGHWRRDNLVLLSLLQSVPARYSVPSMEGKLTLTKSLADCMVGESKTITLTVTPTSNDKNGFEADVDEVVDYEEEGAGEDKADAKESDEPMEGEMMGMGKSAMGKPSKMAPAARKAMYASSEE